MRIIFISSEPVHDEHVAYFLSEKLFHATRYYLMPAVILLFLVGKVVRVNDLTT